jgi:hypothetical protein
VTVGQPPRGNSDTHGGNNEHNPETDFGHL